MVTESYKDKLRQQFLAKAEAVFEAAMERGIARDDVDLSQIEEVVSELKFELTGLLVQSMIEVQTKQQSGPGPICKGCGREMRYKGQKKRTIVTSQGEIELERPYYYCKKCKRGFFPPGPPNGDKSPGVE